MGENFNFWNKAYVNRYIALFINFSRQNIFNSYVVQSIYFAIDIIRLPVNFSIFTG